MYEYYRAVSDFRRTRSRANLTELLARLTGQSIELLSYEEVRRKLRASGIADRRVEEVPIEAIVGSVNRYHDFTRDFLPRTDSAERRWASVKMATAGMGGLPAVDLYKIGSAYFVNDGHHRISVARDVGATTIQAHVTEIRSRVPLSPDTSPDELIIRAEYATFLEQTNLDMLRPSADLSVTRTGQYIVLLEHIEVHRYYMGINSQSEIPFEEAATHWFDEVYIPVVRIIRNLGLLHYFPGRTETDLYLWIATHRAEIEEELGREVPYSAAAADLGDKEGTHWSKVVSRVAAKVRDLVIPDDLEMGPSLGSWRREIQAEERSERLFQDILVPLSGNEAGWIALEQAIAIAQLESAKIHAVHIVEEPDVDEGRRHREISDRFFWRLGEVNLYGTFKVEAGNVAKIICNEARWADLVVIGLTYPPPDSVLGRLGSGIRRLLLSCSRPILIVPDGKSALSLPLLAYDGSPKAKEALFLAAYVAGCWKERLVVLSAEDGVQSVEDTSNEARAYLEQHDIMVDYVLVEGEAADQILAKAEEHTCDWIIMGGYGSWPVKESMLGSTLHGVLKASRMPVLVCR